VLHGGSATPDTGAVSPPPTSLTPAVALVSLVSSPPTRPTPPKKSALEVVTLSSEPLVGRSPLALSASKIVQVSSSQCSTPEIIL